MRVEWTRCRATRPTSSAPALSVLGLTRDLLHFTISPVAPRHRLENRRKATTRRFLLVVAMLSGSLTLLPLASATWTASGSGPAAARSTTINAGNAPSLGVSGDAVQLVWKASTLASGAPVTGYLVKRYDATGAAQAITSGSCATTVEANSCSETSVPDGSWRYSVTPVHNSWRGAEGPTSTARVAATPSAAIAFPSVGTLYGLEGFTGGCGTPLEGDVCGTVVDAGSGITGVKVSLQLGTGSYWDGTAFASGTELLLDATGTSSWSFPFSASSFPADGPYTLRVQAVDGAGVVGVASSTFTVDRDAPVAPTIDSAPVDPSGSAAASFTFSTSEAEARFRCRLDGSAWADCVSPRSYSELTEGLHTFEVRSVDASGNISAATSRSWVVDTAAPAAAVTFPAHGSVYNNSGFTDGCGTASTGDVCGTSSDSGSGVARVQVSVQRGTGSYWNGTEFTSSAEVLLDATGTSSWLLPFSATSFPADGQYTLRARVTDAAGNTTVTTSTFTVDRVPPVAPTIDSAPANPSGSAAATFTFSSTEAGVGFECRLDGSVWAACTSPRSHSGLAEGSHTFEVRSVDASGNIGAATSRSWVVDTAAPAGAVTFPTNGSSHASGGTTNNFNAGCGTASTGDVCGTSSDTGIGVARVQVSVQQGAGSYWNGTGFASSTEVLLDATGTTSWSLPFSATSFPADGQYTLRVRVTDTAGNTAMTTTTFTVDVTAPRAVDVQTANGTGTPGQIDTNGSGDSITFTYSERIRPASILTGWDGTTSASVSVKVHEGAARTNDSLTIWNGTETIQLPLGSVNLGGLDYTASEFSYSSTMTQNGADIKIVLGARVGKSNTATTTPSTMTWTPSSIATDLLGNPTATTAVTESGAADKEF